MQTKLIISALSCLIPKITDSLGLLTLSVKNSIRNLGVTMDQALTLNQYILDINLIYYIKLDLTIVTLFLPASVKHPWIVYRWSKMLLLIF